MDDDFLAPSKFWISSSLQAEYDARNKRTECGDKHCDDKIEHRTVSGVLNNSPPINSQINPHRRSEMLTEEPWLEKSAQFQTVASCSKRAAVCLYFSRAFCFLVPYADTVLRLTCISLPISRPIAIRESSSKTCPDSLATRNIDCSQCKPTKTGSRGRSTRAGEQHRRRGPGNIV